MEAIAAVAGIAVIASVMWDVFETVLLPRPAPSGLRVSSVLTRATWPIWRGLGSRARSANLRERVLGMYAPLLVVLLLALWMALLITGLGLILFALHDQISPHPDLGLSIYFAATSILTIGFGDVIPTGTGARIVSVMGGAAGLGVVALVITYLFMLFGSFQRRERLVVALAARAGSPPSGVAVLESFSTLGLVSELPVFFESWEVWASEVLDTHVSYPILGFFRSTHDNVSWISSLGAVLDAACFCRAALAGVETGHAELMARVGMHFVEDISNYLHIAPSDGPGVTRDEFDEACTRLEEAGYALRPADEAWGHFAAMRTKYAARLTGLGAYWSMVAPAWAPPRLRHPGKLARHNA